MTIFAQSIFAHPITLVKILCQFIVLLLSVVLFAPTLRGQPIRTVALSFDPAPGLAGVQFDKFLGAPSLNNLGQVAFVSATTDGGRVGVWSEGGGILHKAAYFDDINGVRSFVSPILNDQGKTAFLGTGLSAINSVLVESVGQVEVVASVGQDAPGKSGRFGSQLVQAVFTDLAFNHAGDVAFVGRITGDGIRFPSENLVWFRDENGLVPIAHQGKTAPIVGFPFQISDLLATEILVNASGEVAFDAGLTRGSSQDQGGIVYAGQPGSLRIVAQGNTQAAGFPSEVSYASLGGYSPGGLSLNAVGDVVFDGFLFGPGINSSNNSAIWAETDGTVRIVAREGQPVPGLDPTVVFGSALFRPVINEQRMVAFQATLAGPSVHLDDNEALWVGPLDSPVVCVREGEPVAGVDPTAKFRHLNDFAEGLSLNALGQIAFKRQLEGDGINNTNDVGIWATDTSGTVHLIAREGNSIEVRPGVIRTVQELDFAISTNNENGHASTFNDMGQVAFRAVFTDRSEGVFVSNLVAIPEPASIVLFFVRGDLWFNQMSLAKPSDCFKYLIASFDMVGLTLVGARKRPADRAELFLSKSRLILTCTDSTPQVNVYL